MPTDEHDIIGRIDDLTSPDAMRSTPAGGADEHDGVRALFLGAEGPSVIHLDADDITGDIARRVGDPFIDRMGYLGIADFWVGDNSLSTSPRNVGASFVLEQAMRDAASGDLAIPDVFRDHLRKVLTDPYWAPVIHGPCVLVGACEPETVSLPDHIIDWFDRLARDTHIASLIQLVDEALSGVGIDADVYLLGPE